VCLPIYLDGQLQKRLERIARKKGWDLGDVVSDLLIKDVTCWRNSSDCPGCQPDNLQDPLLVQEDEETN
jgi:hypothetical protein